MSESTEGILYERSGAVAVLTLNRPESLNAQTPDFWKELVALIQRANADRAVGAIVLTGAGRAFCAGGDMKESFLPHLLGERPYEEDDPYLGGLGLPVDWVSLVRESKPLIAAVNGMAVGGGATLILPFDVIVAAEEASFNFVFVKVGAVPELCSSHYLSARVGWGRASEIVLSGRAVGASEALEIGLVNRVVPQAELMPTALSMAEKIAANPAVSLRLTKRLLTENPTEQDTAEIWQRESDALREAFASPEHREAVTAFVEKRKPDFARARDGSS